MPVEIDMLEDKIYRLSPELLDILLIDRTTSREDCPCNIFWATSDYEHLGKGYEYKSPILPELITGNNGHVIMPRVLKRRDLQRNRSRIKAEVFTPSWVCNLQANTVDSSWFGREDVFNHENDDHTWTTNTKKITFPEGKTWRDYVRSTCLEITCGEAPYLVSRYDTTTGQPIALENRIGLLDRKLRVVNENTETSSDWLKWAQVAFQSTYGYEWQGDSLLIARENLLLTFTEYYQARFNRAPQTKTLLNIANIISWNMWQMDGLKCVIPNSCSMKPSAQQSLFDEPEMIPCQGCKTGNMHRHNGIYCIIKDWQKNETLTFVSMLKERK